MRRGDFLEPQRRGRAVAALTASVTVVAAVIALNAGSAAGETPAERCARETAAYNAAWESTWWASNPGNPGPPPPPPVPYVCHDPGEPTTTTTTTPAPTAPGLQPTQAPGAGVQGQAGNAPGQLPQGNGTDIVTVPSAPADPQPQATDVSRLPPPAPDTSAPIVGSTPPSAPALPFASPGPTVDDVAVQRPQFVNDASSDKPDGPPADEGPAADGCASCPTNSQTGYLIPGDVGPVPSAGDRWAGGDRWVNHWVIESVTSKGQGIPPGDRPLLGQCIPPEGRSGYVGNTSFGVAFTDQAINMTQTGWNVGGKGTIGGATGPVELGGEVNGGYSSSTSKSTSKTLSLTGQVDCSQYGDPGPGKVWKFYQGYQRLEWTGRWELYRCSLFGCEKKDEQKVRGIYWVPLSVALGRPEPL